MPNDAVELRKEFRRLLALADAAADPEMRKGFIRLALHYAELAFKFEKRERAKADLRPEPRSKS